MSKSKEIRSVSSWGVVFVGIVVWSAVPDWTDLQVRMESNLRQEVAVLKRTNARLLQEKVMKRSSGFTLNELL